MDVLCAGLTANWTGASSEEWRQRCRESGALSVTGLLRRHGIPQRLAEALAAELAAPAGAQIAQLPKADLEGLLTLLTAYPLPYSGHKGYSKVCS